LFLFELAQNNGNYGWKWLYLTHGFGDFSPDPDNFIRLLGHVLGCLILNDFLIQPYQISLKLINL
jgi:hypothetical protein